MTSREILEALVEAEDALATRRNWYLARSAARHAGHRNRVRVREIERRLDILRRLIAGANLAAKLEADRDRQ